MKTTEKKKTENRICFFKKVSKVCKTVSRKTKRKTQIRIKQLKSEKGANQYYKNKYYEYYKQLYSNKLENLEEMVKFLEICNEQ